MKPLAIIPARGGSRGVPGKNIRPLGGRPLIHYTIEAARACFEDGRILVSTDDEEIRRTAEETGLEVPFLRPPHLADDRSPMRDVLLHALEWSGEQGYAPDVLVLLQPTSPFRTARHIREAMELWDPELEMVVSVKETEANPYYVLFEENEQGYLESVKEGRFTTRQECPPVWELNGAIYLMRTDSLRKRPKEEFTRVRKYVMDRRSSHDIDTEVDWYAAEKIHDQINENPVT